MKINHTSKNTAFLPLSPQIYRYFMFVNVDTLKI